MLAAARYIYLTAVALISLLTVYLQKGGAVWPADMLRQSGWLFWTPAALAVGAVYLLALVRRHAAASAEFIARRGVPPPSPAPPESADARGLSIDETGLLLPALSPIRRPWSEIGPPQTEWIKRHSRDDGPGQVFGVDGARTDANLLTISVAGLGRLSFTAEALQTAGTSLWDVFEAVNYHRLPDGSMAKERLGGPASRRINPASPWAR